MYVCKHFCLIRNFNTENIWKKSIFSFKITNETFGNVFVVLISKNGQKMKESFCIYSWDK
jgi:hypothetical protein